MLSELCISAKIVIFCDKIIGGKNAKDHYPSFVFSAKIAIFRDKIIGGKNTKDHYPSFIFSASSFVILAN